MAKKLYVGGLAWATTDESLRAAFAQCGNVDEAIVIKDRMSGRSKGFGFVTMSNDDEATAAIAAFDGKEIDGRRVTVNEARPMEPRAPREGGGFRRNGGGGGGFRGGDRNRDEDQGASW